MSCIYKFLNNVHIVSLNGNHMAFSSKADAYEFMRTLPPATTSAEVSTTTSTTADDVKSSPDAEASNTLHLEPNSYTIANVFFENERYPNVKYENVKYENVKYDVQHQQDQAEDQSQDQAEDQSEDQAEVQPEDQVVDQAEVQPEEKGENNAYTSDTVSDNSDTLSQSSDQDGSTKKTYIRDMAIVEADIYDDTLKNDNSLNNLQATFDKVYKKIVKISNEDPKEKDINNAQAYINLAFNKARDMLIRDLRNDIADALVAYFSQSKDANTFLGKSSNNSSISINVILKKRDVNGKVDPSAMYPINSLNDRIYTINCNNGATPIKFRGDVLFYGYIDNTLKEKLEYKKGFIYRNKASFKSHKCVSPFFQLQREVNFLSKGTLVLFDFTDSKNPTHSKFLIKNSNDKPVYPSWHYYNIRSYTDDKPSLLSELYYHYHDKHTTTQTQHTRPTHKKKNTEVKPKYDSNTNKAKYSKSSIEDNASDQKPVKMKKQFKKV